MQQSLSIGHIHFYSPGSFKIALETSDLRVNRFVTSDHSFGVYRFRSGPIRASLKKAIRSTALHLNERLATKLFTYHCTALCLKA